MSTIQLRVASKEDAELIADLSRQTFVETFADANTPEDMAIFLDEQFSRKMLIDEVGSPQTYFFLAMDGEEAVGYLKLRDGVSKKEFNQKTSIEIARLYAVKSAIGKGIGKMLMQKAIDIALEMHRELIWLGVWENNHRAIEFYHKWGFEKFAEHRFILGNDVQTDWLMWKVL
ncbi:MAG: GNAT family N-acetyltransferase [Chitinophagaceae bacterium]|nr:GNAT family N-acetyltransferase [Chitinophagaceae bacterium]